MVKKFDLFYLLFLGFLGLFFAKYDVAAQSIGHKAHHGGVLNVIGEESGHVEVLIRGDLLEAWFVGGRSRYGPFSSFRGHRDLS